METNKQKVCNNVFSISDLIIITSPILLGHFKITFSLLFPILSYLIAIDTENHIEKNIKSHLIQLSNAC